jgi:hypothetical protein
LTERWRLMYQASDRDKLANRLPTWVIHLSRTLCKGRSKNKNLIAFAPKTQLVRNKRNA